MRRVRTFLCHGSRSVELSDGQTLVVGRGAKCDVVLNDDLASREHFRIRLDGLTIRLEDLGSRNGVLVNGLLVRGVQELHHGDQITAGRTPLSIVQQAHEPRDREESATPPIRVRSDADATESGNLYVLLEGSTRTALAAGDLTSAEGSGRSLLVALRGYVTRGRSFDEAWLDGALDLALDLADASRERVWLDRALFTAAKRPIDAERVARLQSMASGPPSSDTVRAYLDEVGDMLDAAARTALERLG